MKNTSMALLLDYYEIRDKKAKANAEENHRIMELTGKGLVEGAE